MVEFSSLKENSPNKKAYVGRKIPFNVKVEGQAPEKGIMHTREVAEGVGVIWEFTDLPPTVRFSA